MLKNNPKDGTKLSSTQELNNDLRLKGEAALGPEDSPSALAKYLINRERFGVNPCFPSELLEELGGWDETYRGWGGEDPDLIERSCALGYTLVRAYDLLYFHMPHDWMPNGKYRHSSMKTGGGSIRSVKDGNG